VRKIQDAALSTIYQFDTSIKYSSDLFHVSDLIIWISFSLDFFCS